MFRCSSSVEVPLYCYNNIRNLFIFLAEKYFKSENIDIRMVARNVNQSISPIHVDA